MREEICCLTGHRRLPQNQMEGITEALKTAAEKLIAEGVKCFRVGGAVGFDTLAAQVLFALRERHPEIRVVLYYPFDGFTDGWSAEQTEVYQRLLPLYDDVICVCRRPKRPAYAYLKRDRWMVEGAGYVIAYCTKKTGGTAYTVRHAEKSGCKVWFVIERENYRK